MKMNVLSPDAITMFSVLLRFFRNLVEMDLFTDANLGYSILCFAPTRKKKNQLAKERKLLIFIQFN